MNPSKGYYSIIQYCPDLARLEAANIGVLLFCPEEMYLQGRTVRDNKRIRHFFGSEGHDWARINSFKQGIEERLVRESGSITSLDELERFIATRGNQFQMTPPRPMKVREPDRELDRLFAELVDGQQRARSEASLPRLIGQRFAAAGLQRKVQRDVPVVVPVFEREVRIPYAYHNGRFNLIQPVRFESRDPAQIEITACRYAVEGRSLYQHADSRHGELQLVVVGKFAAQNVDTKDHVRRLLEKHDVRLFGFDQLPTLIDEIRRTGCEIE